jgi:hypothetical protein
MCSKALRRWQGPNADELDRLEQAHQTLGGSAPGRRWRLQHLNDAYIVLLAAYFQSFCRDLHSEAASAMARAVQPAGVRDALLAAMQANRRLDRGNASAENIGQDFARFGMTFWAQVDEHDTRNKARRARFDQLLIWRNAIAHQDFQFSQQQRGKLGATNRSLAWIKRWRANCDLLAMAFDAVLGQQLRTLSGESPWV